MRRSFQLGERQTLFTAGEHGYHTFRIPALARTRCGTVVVVAEGRRHSVQDWGEIELVLRRSCNGGKSFEPLQVIVAKPNTTCGNPTLVADERTGRVLLLFCENPADQPERRVFEGQAQRSVWVCHSDDDALTFSEPRDITAQVNRESWTWYATGPGHGVQLQNGRLVVPCCHARAVNYTHDDPVRAHVILSDDGGASWQPGGVVEVPRSSECGVVEFAPNRVYLDFRNDEKPHTRGGAVSVDAGASFGVARLLPELVDPGCRGGICAAHESIFVSHPRAERRRNLVLECSDDRGETFGEVLTLTDGPAAYSDLLSVNNEQILCAYETGAERPYERIDGVFVTSATAALV